MLKGGFRCRAMGGDRREDATTKRNTNNKCLLNIVKPSFIIAKQPLKGQLASVWQIRISTQLELIILFMRFIFLRTILFTLLQQQDIYSPRNYDIYKKN